MNVTSTYKTISGYSPYELRNCIIVVQNFMCLSLKNLFVFDSNWTSLSTISIGGTYLEVINNTQLIYGNGYISATITRIDLNGNKLSSFTSSRNNAAFNHAIYNSVTQTLGVVDWKTNNIDLFDSLLNYKYSIGTGNYIPMFLDIFNGTFYVTAYTGSTSVILKLTNNSYTVAFNLGTQFCSSFYGIYWSSLSFDSYGNFAFICQNEYKFYIFDSFGNYNNNSFYVNSREVTVHTGFDSSDRFFIQTFNAIYIYLN